MIVLYIVLGIVVLFFSLQLIPILLMKKKKGKEMPELDGKYKKAMKNKGTSLFYFYNENCRACIPMTPVINELRASYKNCYKVNSSKEMNVAKQFGIMATPTTIIVKNRKIDKVLVGAQSRDKLEIALNS